VWIRVWFRHNAHRPMEHMERLGSHAQSASTIHDFGAASVPTASGQQRVADHGGHAFVAGGFFASAGHANRTARTTWKRDWLSSAAACELIKARSGLLGVLFMEPDVDANNLAEEG
jgi:hypothetical protein